MRKPYTSAELKEFDRLTKMLHNSGQMVRIRGRILVQEFLKKHGKAKCNAMFAVLVERDARV